MIVDKLTKSSHFWAMRVIASVLALSKLYVKEIERFHGGTTLYCLRSRSSFYIAILTVLTESFGNKNKVEFSFSSTN